MFYQKTTVTVKGIKEIQNLLEKANEQLSGLSDTIDQIRKSEIEFGINEIQSSESSTKE